MAQDATSLIATSNYLISLCGYYQFRAIVAMGNPGGTVSPIVAGVTTPITIQGSDFANTTDWEYAPYVGKNVTVFSNGIARYLVPLQEWIYIPTGIRIIMPGFDSSLMDYVMVVTIIR